MRTARPPSQVAPPLQKITFRPLDAETIAELDYLAGQLPLRLRGRRSVVIRDAIHDAYMRKREKEGHSK